MTCFRLISFLCKNVSILVALNFEQRQNDDSNTYIQEMSNGRSENVFGTSRDIS